MKSYIVNWQTASMGLTNPVNEVNTLPSMTVPGMSLSLRELLDRYVRGENITTFNPVYTDADIPDDIERLDEMDRLDLSREIKTRISRFRSNPVPAPSAPALPAPADALPHPDMGEA